MSEFTQIGTALVFHLLDLVTGLVGAVRNKDLKSSKMRDGLFKKLGFVFCYILAFLMDTQGETIGLEIGVKILPAIIIYAVTTELVSILENICKINPDLVPLKLKDIFHINVEEGEKDA